MAERNEDIEGIEKKLRYLEGNIPSVTIDPNPPELEDIRTRISKLRSGGIEIPATTRSLLERVESGYTQSYYLTIGSVIATIV